jgi:hypothetical protein
MGCIDNVKIKINVTDPFCIKDKDKYQVCFVYQLSDLLNRGAVTCYTHWSFFMNAIKHWFFAERRFLN